MLATSWDAFKVKKSLSKMRVEDVAEDICWTLPACGARQMMLATS